MPNTLEVTIMKKHIIICYFLTLVLVIAGCTASTPKPPVPKLDEIDSMSFLVSLDTSVNLQRNNQTDASKMQKILDYINEAKSEGYDDNVPSQSIITNTLTIKLKDGSICSLTPSSNNVVYFFKDKNIYKLVSSNLNNWLWNGWKVDLNNK
jgi:hypothetical protein